MLRITIVILFLLICTSGVVAIFWKQEIKYSLPTPIPSNFKQVSIKSTVDLNFTQLKGPLFLHFYNPECPCSRFNASHVNQLIRSHGDSIRFVIVVPSVNDIESATEKFGDKLKYIVDYNNKIANTCGVYSTPQAVLLTKFNTLYFRGNYNKSRYCSNQAFNYAELALLSYFNNQSPPPLDLAASVSYGCELSDQINSSTELF